MRGMTLEEWRMHDDLGNCDELLAAEDAAFIDEHGIVRVGGGVECEVCGKSYYDHRSVLGALYLTRLCDGRLVKL